MKPATRQKVNIIIDIAMFVVMILVTMIGIVIRYVLIPGSERWVKYGKNVELTIWGMDRHDWGLVHLIVGLFLIGLLVLHLVFHWKQIVCLVKKLVPNSAFRITIVSILFVFSCVSVVTPLFISPDVAEQGKGFGRNKEFHEPIVKPVTENSNAPQKKIQVGEAVAQKKVGVVGGNIEEGQHAHEEHLLNIRGYNTIAELSKKYDVPAEKLKGLLNIPSDVSNNERLGRIRRNHNFTMSDVEEAILKLQGK